jgi:hypothetical protein
MAHEPYCNCCGCSQLRILDAGFIESLNTTGKFVDYPTSSPTEVTVVDAGWQFIGGRLVGGKSKLDLGASQLSIVGGYLPLLRRGATYVYQSGNPPQNSELQATASVSLYDNTQAVFTAELVERAIPQDADNVWVIGYQAGQAFKSATSWPGALEPGRYVYGWRESRFWYGSPFYRSLYQVNIQAAVSQQFEFRGFIVNTYTGDAEPFLVSAFFDLPEVAGVVAGASLPAHAGTPLSAFKSRSLEGIGSLVLFSETLSLYEGFDGGYGWTVSEPQPAWQGTSPPILVGYDLKLSLSLGSDERLVLTARPSVNPLPLRTAIECLAQPNGESLPTQGFFTASADRGSMLPGAVTPAHRTVTIYRNGEQVFSANNPTSQQMSQALAQDGVYLTVTEVDDRSIPAWTQPYPNTRRNGPRMLKDFSSSVVDSVPPVIGFTPPDDVYWEGAPAFFPVGRMLSTEPLTNLSEWQATVDEDPSSPITRPMGPLAFSSTTGATVYEASGTYTLRLFRRTDHSDIGGNHPASAPTLQWTAHQKPADDHLGATPKLEDPGLQTREYFRPRLASEPVASLLLTFDRKVNVSQVAASQLTLTKDGQPVQGCAVAPLDDSGQLFRVTIPTGQQTSRSFWLLTYNPGGVVFTNDDIPVMRFASRAEFPAVGKTKTVYVHPNSNGGDVRFSYGRAVGVSTGPLGYVELGANDPPVDSRGYPYAPEPCRLVSRVGWLMADMNGYPRAIDTSSIAGPYQIGRIVSVHSSDSLDTEKNKSSIGITGGFFLDHGLAIGEYSPLVNHEGYTPSVPALTSPPVDCSYFGLTTTIDPCPPANVSACASPRVAQKHASAIRCDGDIGAINISLVAIGENGQPANLSNEKLVLTNQNISYSGDIDFCVNQDTNSLTNEQGSGIAMLLMAKSGQPYTFGKTLDGMELCQNVWACIDQSREAELPLRESRSRQPDGSCAGWPEPLYSVGIEFKKTLTAGQVAELDARPGFQHSQVRRGGQVVTPEKYQPGDRNFATGTAADNRCVEWWQDRKPSMTRAEFQYIRGFSCGVVRRLSGSLKQQAAQGCISAFRAHKTFPALKTTTLGELCLSISIRMVIRADVAYEDRRIKGKYYERGAGGPYSNKCDSVTFEQLADSSGVALATGQMDYDTCDFSQGTQFIADQRWTEWGSISDGDEVGTKTVNHHFLADISDTLVLSKEQEETLAAGGEVLIKATGGPAISYWKLKKG